MQRHFLPLLILSTLMIVSGARESFGQRTSPDTDRKGTAGSTYLLLPLTARSASLGSSVSGGLASMSGLEASLSNPSGLVLSEGTTALFSRMEYVADIGVNLFGASQSFGSSALALTVSSWDIGDIPLTTEFEPEAGEVTWTASFVTIGATYARRLTDRIAAGVTVKALSESIDNTSASGVAFDLGMSYVVGESGFRFGVSLNNFGNSLSYGGDGLIRSAQVRGEDRARTFKIEAQEAELPSFLNFGLSYRRDIATGASVNVLGNFRSNSFSDDQYSFGLELMLVDVLSVRGGYQWEQDLDSNFFDGWNLGAGLDFTAVGTRLMFDYAYRPTEFFDNVNMFTVNVIL